MTYFISEQILSFTPAAGGAGVYQEGEDIGQGKPNTLYDGGKGWMSDKFGYNNGANSAAFREKVFQTRNPFNGAGAPMATLEAGVAGLNAGAGGTQAHHIRFRINSGASFTEIDGVIIPSYAYTQHQFTFSSSLLTSASHRFQAYTSQLGSAIETNSDYSAVAYFKLRYPHVMSMAGENLSELLFRVPANGNSAHFSLADWGSNATSHVYDISAHKRYSVSQVGTTLKCNVDAGSERPLYVQIDNLIRSIAGSELDAVGTSGQFRNPMDLEKDSAFLMISHRSLSTAASTYAAYRNGTHDGRVVLVYIDELYDQFAYGVRYHPLSIRGFCDYTLDQWSTPPQYLFLAGKAIQESQHRGSETKRAQCLVPTMGSPPTDNYFTMGLGSAPYAPTIATGRIAALTNGDLNAYKDKLRLAELAQNDEAAQYTMNKKLWQKRILHFAGGSNTRENEDFINYLNGYKNVLEGEHFGGKTYLFAKTSGEVIEQLDVDTLRKIIHDGVAMMTFFGHGTSVGFDINVDDPSDWNNEGRYPMVMALSCFSGNIHLYDDGLASISEQYVLIPNAGAIAFVAAPGLSLTSQLNEYTGLFHANMGVNQYGESLGAQLLATAQSFSSPNAGNTDDKRKISMALEMTLHGDPAFKLYPHERSELTINDPNQGIQVRFEPAVITNDVDSFDVVVDITNLGRYVSKPFTVHASRLFPTSREADNKFLTVSNLGYSKEVRFRFDVNDVDGIGDNEMHIEVDLPSDSIPEFDEFQNNTVTALDFTIIESDLSPVYPYNFGVVGSMDVTLKANTGYPFAPSKEYVFQIDTTDTYDSPFLQSQNMTQSGAILHWNPNLLSFGFQDSTVFFWRVRPADDETKWREFSFQVIQNQFGWGQDHFFQFKVNDFDHIEYDRTKRQFHYSEASRELYVNNVGSPANDNEYYSTKYALDGLGAPFGEYGVAPAIAIAVIDTLNLEPWGTYGVYNGQLINSNHQFGNSNNFVQGSTNSRVLRVEYWFSFLVKNATQMDAMVNMITNEVPDGYYILAYSLGSGLFQDAQYWQESHYQAFEALGADSIRYVENTHPYIFFTKKGDASVKAEVLGHEPRDVITLNTKVYSNVKQGDITGPEIGPAMAWREFILKSGAQEANSQEEVLSKAIGTNIQQIETELASLTESGSADISSTNADSTLRVNLDYFTRDDAAGTPGQLRSWHVLYDPAPDAAINPIEGVAYRTTSVNAGEKFFFGVAFENISEFAFNEFQVHYWMTSSDGVVAQDDTVTYAGMSPEQVIFDSVEIFTAALNGRYTLWMEVNPLGKEWHKEEYSFNNKAYRTLTVTADQSNPLLDVTFDGIHILNRDIVSPTPEIVMELKDENSYLLMKDTTSFDVYLTVPGGSHSRIPFVQNGKEIMAFEAASDSKNKARVYFKPESLDDGIYTLSVMGRDASGNAAGSDDYNIEFEVVNKSTVTQVMNYPNPFTTSTRFVFTLTGSKVPDVFTIQILTITGKVIREITKDELGPINIGRNMTQYAWDGTDEFGDRLANGVYLYRVIMKIDGSAIERKASGADQYFTQEFGKMSLFR